MRYITDLNDINEREPSVVTLGKFDGLHRGHMKIFNTARNIARTTDSNFAVFTFSIDPAAALGKRACKVLMTSDERKERIEETGADVMAECAFDDTLRNMEAEEFIEKILVKKLKAKAVITGRDFRFGKDRKGDAALLREYSARYGYYAEALEKEKDGDRIISSSYIREEIEDGHMEIAARMLGYDYYISGTVTSGRKIGRTLGFPTANLVPQNEKIMPPYGVYSSLTSIGDEIYKSITDIGTKPTVSGKALGAETHIIGFSRDIYGQKIKVSLLRHMRGEQKFASLGELEEQLERDVKERMTYEK